MTATTTTPAVARDLLATKASVGVARSIVSSFVRAQGLQRYEERAVAIVSELATNAVAASASTDTIRIHITIRPGRLCMGVSDRAPGEAPQRREAVSSLEEIDAADSDEFGGWGIPLVAAYADDVWTEPGRNTDHKWVCASIHLPAGTTIEG